MAEANQYNLAQAGNLSPEDFAQQQQLNRQQQMAQMLMQQSAQPQGQMISGRYVAPSWAQNLNSLANVAASQYIGNKADTEAAKLAQQIRQNKSAANQEVLDKYLGTPDKVTEMAGPFGQDVNKTGLDVPMPVAVQPGQKPDLAGALRAIESPTNYYGAGKDLKAAIIKEMRPEPTTNMQEFQEAMKNPQFAAYVERQKLLGRNVTTLAMPPSESEYAKTFGAGVAKQDLTLKDIAENANKNIENVHAQRALLDTGKVITGFGANQRLALAQFGKAAGLTGKDDKDLASNTQSFLAGRAGSTLDAIQGSNLGSAQGFSNTDREFLQDAKLGKITYDEKSLRRQLDLEEKVARAGAEKWNTRLKEMPKSASAPINANPIQLPKEYQMPGVDNSNPLLNPNR